MPLELPNLDDRTYEDLVKEGLSLIPTYAPEWTNHNPSDPGITLIELFAYLCEMMIYRLNRVTNANKQAFLNLINGPEWRKEHPILLDDEALNDAIRQAVANLRQSDRAITPTDFESVALRNPAVSRAKCLPQRNLEIEDASQAIRNYPSHISVILLPKQAAQPSPELIDQVKRDLDKGRLLTTQIHVVGPRYLTIGIRMRLVLKSDALETEVKERAIAALRQFFSPLPDAKSQHRGWPFGRDIYVSELYELLDQLPGVDYVEKIDDLDEVTDSPSTRRQVVQGNLFAITLYADELVDVQINDDLKIQSPLKAR